ncbi:MAG TPA: asparaginase [Candidatus Eremiobacteraceae bacterium]|nr:asparaginase [Candidatus Eremiobacteraceae bacterium]
MNRTILGFLMLTLSFLTLSQAADAQKLPTVAVLSTGGTIASKHDPLKGGYLPALSGEELVAAVPAIKKVAQIQVEQISNISSSDMTPEIWVRLAARVNALLADPAIAGIVVTHGTNTLEETAYFLDLTTRNTKPVVLVGAERPASDFDSDGPRNLLDAIRVASAPEALDKGVMVVMNGQVNAARDVTKTNTSQVETFRSLEFGALGVVDAQSVRFYRTPLRRQTIAIDSGTHLAKIDIVMSYAGADGQVIRAMLGDGAVQGLVVAGLGLGGVPGSMYDVIKEARAKGIPVAISTRVPTGRIFPLSATKGSALSLRQMGCVLTDNLSPQKARILLMLALTKTRDPETLQKYFDN